MIDLLSFSTELLGATIYSLIVSTILYGLGNLLSQHYPHIQLWRDYWLVLIILCILPIIYFFIPTYSSHLSIFDINQLQLAEAKTNQIITLAQQKSFKLQYAEIGAINSIALIWLFLMIAGSLYYTGHFILQLKRIKQIIKQSIPVKEAKSHINKFHYKQLVYLQDSTKIKILITNASISPFAFHFKEKYMVLPLSMFENLSRQQIDLIVRHELIHLNKYDPLVLIFTHFLFCFTWFNPFIKALRQKMNWAIETSCDNQVLSRKPHLRKTYAKLMLKILRESATQTSNHVVAAFSIKTQKSITMRITNIMKASHPDVKFKFKKTKLYSNALALACLTFITQPQLNAAEPHANNMMLNPVKTAKISSAYGASNRFHKFHKGIDLAAKLNTPIVATTGGIVRISTDLMKNRKNYGTTIIIDHANGLHSVYAHLNSRAVKQGEHVDSGQLIGYVGQTGKASGPHLHLELLKDNQHVDPSLYINFH